MLGQGSSRDTSTCKHNLGRPKTGDKVLSGIMQCCRIRHVQRIAGMPPAQPFVQRRQCVRTARSQAEDLTTNFSVATIFSE